MKIVVILTLFGSENLDNLRKASALENTLKTYILNSGNFKGFIDPLKPNYGPSGVTDPKVRTPELKVPVGKHFPLRCK